MVVFGGVVQDSVEMHFVDLRHRADVPRHAARHFHMLLALQHEQMPHLEGFAPIADVQLAVFRDRSLVDAKHPHLAHIRVDGDFEDMRDHVLGGVVVGVKFLRRRTLTFVELRRIAFRRIGQQQVDRVEQFGDTGAIACRNEQHRNQVPFAQRLFQRRMQLARIDVAVVQVALDKFRVHFHHLLDERAVGVGHRAEVALALRVKKTIDHFRTAGGGQVQRQAFLAEGLAQLFQQGGQVHALGVDLVDDDDAAQIARLGPLHHAHAHHLDAGGGVDHHRRRVHRFERRHRLADEIGVARRVDEVHARAAMFQVQDGGVQRMLGAPLHRVEVAHRRAALQAARRADRAAAVQQGFGQTGFARRCLADQRQGSNRRGIGVDGVGRHGALLSERCCGARVTGVAPQA